MTGSIDKLDLIRFHYLERIRKGEQELRRLREKLKSLEEFMSESESDNVTQGEPAIQP